MSKQRCKICGKKVPSKHVIDRICKYCQGVSKHKPSGFSVSTNRKRIKSTRKICPNCGIEKYLQSEFGKRGGKKKKWYKSWCKICQREYSKEYKQKEGYREKNAAYMREYRKKSSIVDQ